MKSTVKNDIHIRIDDNLKHRLNSFFASNPGVSISDLFRESVMWYLTRDIEDRELVALNVQRLVKQIEDQKDKTLLQMELISHFIRVWLVYVPDIPDELRKAAWKAGEIRYDKFMDGFKVKLKKETKLIPKLLMGFLENGEETGTKKQE